MSKNTKSKIPTLIKSTEVSKLRRERDDARAEVEHWKREYKKLGNRPASIREQNLKVDNCRLNELLGEQAKKHYETTVVEIKKRDILIEQQRNRIEEVEAVIEKLSRQVPRVIDADDIVEGKVVGA